MQSQLQEPDKYKSADEFAEAVRVECLGQDRCPNLCTGFMDVQPMGASAVVRQCLECGYFDYAMNYLPLNLRAVASA
jgi:hypothetical protein